MCFEFVSGDNSAFFICLLSSLILDLCHLQNPELFFLSTLSISLSPNSEHFTSKALLGGPHAGEGKEEKDIRLLPSIPITHNQALLLAVSG